MEQELFNPQSSSVSSSRIIYTLSTFARTSLLHLQEIGSLLVIPKRAGLVSFLSSWVKGVRQCVQQRVYNPTGGNPVK